MVSTVILEQLLAELGYTPHWIEYGFLTAEILALQHAHWKASDDSSTTEHYRYASFRNFLHNKTTFTDAECEQYTLLARNDADSFMAGAAMVDILRMPNLTEAQFMRLREDFSAFGSWTEKFIQQILWKKEVERQAIATKTKVAASILEVVMRLHPEEFSSPVDIHILYCEEGEAANAPIPLWHISAELIVENDAQKHIILGENRTKLEELRLIAEQAIEQYLRDRSNLEISVKVRV